MNNYTPSTVLRAGHTNKSKTVSSGGQNYVNISLQEEEEQSRFP